MIGRKKNPSPQSNDEFRASVKSYHEGQLRQKRLSYEPQPRNASNNSEFNNSLNQLELREIEENTVHELLSKLSVNKARTTPNGATSPLSPTPVQIAPGKTPLMPMQSIPQNIERKLPAFQKHQITPPVFNGAKFSPPSFGTSSSVQAQSSSISTQPKSLNQSIFAPQQKTRLSIATPLSQIQASPIAQLKPTNAVLPQSSTPVQPKIAHIEPVLQQKVDNNQIQINNLVQSPSTLTPTIQQTIPTSAIQHPIPTPAIQPQIPSNLPILANQTPTPIKDPQPIRQRRPSKSETPESSKFSHWVKTILQSYENYMLKLREFKSNTAVLPICNQVRMGIQETIDVHTSDNSNDIKALSAALIFFQDLYKSGAVKKGDQPLPLTSGGKLFITMCICDRYLKRVVGQDNCIGFVATLFIVLTKNEPELFNVLLSMVFSKCVLPRLDAIQCLEHVVQISNGPAEQSAQWLPEEQARFKLLIKMCALTVGKSQDGMQGQELIQFLLTETIKAPVLPISTLFVLNSILSTDLTYYQKRNPAEFADLVQKSRAICELDWPVIIRTTVDAARSDVQLNDRAMTLLTAKNSVLLQNLKTSIASIKI